MAVAPLPTGFAAGVNVVGGGLTGVVCVTIG